MAGVLDDLAARGLIHDSTDRQALAERLDAGPVTVYCGLDPTADSLHVGNLQSLLLLRRVQDHGHRAIALAGGATGLIGDPSGRDAERNLLDDETVTANVTAITAQMRRFIAFDGPNPAILVDNRDWTAPMSVLEFLRDVGKHVTVNTMLARDSVRSRMERDSGLSYTEFSYMLLQANDYVVLHDRHGCELQVAGSDQWGNIVAGIDLIRRRSGATVHGLTAPLITGSDGKKFGKSTGGGGVWLDAARTSPYQLFQYFMATDDRDVGPWLLRLTLVGIGEIGEIVAAHEAAPHRRDGQRRLAREIVSLVHGAPAVGPVEAATSLLFGVGGLEAGGHDAGRLSDEVVGVLAAEIPTTEVRSAAGRALDVVEVVATAFGVSRGEVRRNARGYRVAGRSLDDPAVELPASGCVLLRKGKADHHLVQILDPDDGVTPARHDRGGPAGADPRWRH